MVFGKKASKAKLETSDFSALSRPADLSKGGSDEGFDSNSSTPTLPGGGFGGSGSSTPPMYNGVGSSGPAGYGGPAHASYGMSQEQRQQQQARSSTDAWGQLGRPPSSFEMNALEAPPQKAPSVGIKLALPEPQPGQLQRRPTAPGSGIAEIGRGGGAGWGGGAGGNLPEDASMSEIAAEAMRTAHTYQPPPAQHHAHGGGGGGGGGGRTVSVAAAAAGMLVQAGDAAAAAAAAGGAPGNGEPMHPTTELFIAAKYNRPSGWQVAVDKGAEVNYRYRAEVKMFGQGHWAKGGYTWSSQYAEHCDSLLIIAVKEGNAALCDFLLGCRGIDVALKNDSGRDVFTIAMELNRLSLLSKMDPRLMPKDLVSGSQQVVDMKRVLMQSKMEAESAQIEAADLRAKLETTERALDKAMLANNKLKAEVALFGFDGADKMKEDNEQLKRRVVVAEAKATDANALLERINAKAFGKEIEEMEERDRLVQALRNELDSTRRLAAERTEAAAAAAGGSGETSTAIVVANRSEQDRKRDRDIELLLEKLYHAKHGTPEAPVNSSAAAAAMTIADLADRDRDIKALKENVAVLEQKLAKERSSALSGSEVERRLERKNGEIEKLRETAETLKNEVRDKEGVMMKLMEELRRKSAKLEQVEAQAQQAASADAMLERKYHEIRGLEAKVTAAKNESKEKDGVILKLVEELKKKSRMAEHAEKLDEKTKKAEAEVENLKRQLEKYAQLESEARYLHMKLDTSERMGSKMADEITELRERIVALGDRNATLSSAIVAAAGANKQADERFAAAEEARAEAEEKMAAALTKAAQAEESLEASAPMLLQASAELERALKELDAKGSEADAGKAAVKQLEKKDAEIALAKKQVAELRGATGATTAKLLTAKEESIAALTAKVADLEGQVAARAARVAELEAAAAGGEGAKPPAAAAAEGSPKKSEDNSKELQKLKAVIYGHVAKISQLNAAVKQKTQEAEALKAELAALRGPAAAAAAPAGAAAAAAGSPAKAKAGT